MGAVLAIDLGTKKTGFAVADGLRLSITLLECPRIDGTSDKLLDHVAGLLDERDVDVLLLGWPLNMDGTGGPQTDYTQAFAERLRARFAGLEVVPYDERLTSKEAESRLREEGASFREMLKHRDSAAAAVLLQDWIESGEPR
ncbi:Putative Holliday junction resolvase [Planctomycetes bacterium Pla163]|uniref:Putative pre-16S rRNA nuclease n=1 Tax=Rohdeia mirabilis TaxID=2528008 RepID=A0A518D204_9BACT|nr:Putative Holliday junction resolvase [Planctomycetes bacterium Pla163]